MLAYGLLHVENSFVHRLWKRKNHDFLNV
jgi:hypothetical protein